jgi:transcriptional repressor NrdR
MWVSASLFPPDSSVFYYDVGMRCVICRHEDTKVVDSRTAEDGAAIRRRRECPQCLHRFTTFERMDEVPLMVTKTHGGR